MAQFKQIGGFSQRPLFVAALAAFSLLGPGQARLAHAQQTGTIKGTAEDVNGAPVRGIKVAVHGKSLIGGGQERLTDADGSFRFVELPPGKYSVKAEAKGFRGYAQDNVAVNIGATVSLTLLMEAETATEVVTVTARPPVVDTEKTVIGQNISGERLQDVPSGRSYQDTAVFLPGVVDNGSGNPTIHGGSLYSNQYLVDGVNTTDPTTNTFSLNFNFDAIEEVQVISGAFSPEYGNVTGGVVNVVTKSGSNEFQLDSSLYYASDKLTMQGLDEQPRDFRSLQFNVNVGGPIMKDKLWYFFSGEFDDSVSQLPAESPVPELDGLRHAQRQFRSFYWLGKLTWAPADHNRVTLLAQGDPTRIENSDQSSSATNDSETQQDQGGLLASLRWDGVFDPLVFKVQGAYKRQFLDIFPQKRADGGSVFSFPGMLGFGHLTTKNHFGVVDGCIAVDPADPALTADDLKQVKCSGDVQASPEFGHGQHYNFDNGETTIGSGSDYYIMRTRWQGTATASYFLDAGKVGKHDFKVGMDLALMKDEETDSYPGGASIFYETDMDGDGVADPYAARLASSDSNKLTTAADGSVLAFFALDSWKLWDRLMLQPGVRVEQAKYGNYEGKTMLDFTVVAPRFGFSWDLLGDGKNRVHGGYGQLYETGNLSLSKFVGTSLQTRLAFWDSTTQRYVEDPDHVRIQGGPGGAIIAGQDCAANQAKYLIKDCGKMEPMRTDEYQLGFERALTDTFAADLVYIHRETHNAWEDDEVNLIWNQAGTDIVGSRDGSNAQVWHLRSNSAAHRTYDGVELSFAKIMAENWTLNGSYTLSWLRGTTPEMLTRAYDNERQNVYLEGYLPDDHRHTIKAQLAYRFDSGLSVGAAYTYESGQPYSKFFMNDYDGDYTNRRAPRGYEPGDDLNNPHDDKQMRLPDFTQLDLRASYDFEKLLGQKIEVIADVFNVLNSSTVNSVQEYDTDAGGFGSTTGRQRPFQAQLGLRYKY